MAKFILSCDSPENLDASLHDELAELRATVWPHNPSAPVLEICPLEERPGRKIAIVQCDGHIVACAESFLRRIRLEDGREMDIMALAGVCTLPEYRGRGFAGLAVRKLLEDVDRGKFEAGLWQTGVPGFYEKLGARLIHNRFRNSLHPSDTDKNPFWDPFAILYPATLSDWPEGATVDLLGIGY